MRKFARTLVVLAIVATVAGLIFWSAQQWWRNSMRPQFRTAAVEQGDITEVVNATGTLKPVQLVKVGASVSGPILHLHADFNDPVTKGQLLAEIDTRLYDSAVARDKASLASRKAEVKRVQAQLQQAQNDEARAQKLSQENPEFISDTEMDQLKFKRAALDAELAVAETAVEQAQAGLENSQTNLGYAKILSPVDGIVIDRKVDPGQTLAASFQTPELFTIAPDMRKTMHVYASVDEADIGLIRDAQERGESVVFTVDAYPNDLFQGKIEQVRFSSATTQNVVTYPVIVAAPNADGKLLPGMTASLSFQVQSRSGVLKVPNSALRYFPEPSLVRAEDKDLLEGTRLERGPDEERQTAAPLSANEKTEANRNRQKRHVWVVDGDLLRAVPVVTGISDSRFTELLEGELQAGDALVIAIQRKL